MRAHGGVDLFLAAGHEVLVDVLQGVFGRVAHHRHSVLVRHAQGEEDGGVVVAEVMEAAVKAEAVADVFKGRADGAGGDGDEGGGVVGE